MSIVNLKARIVQYVCVCAAQSRWINEPVWEVSPDTKYPLRQSSYKLYKKIAEGLRSDSDSL